mgnify:CR=1 FL=1
MELRDILKARKTMEMKAEKGGKRSNDILSVPFKKELLAGYCFLSEFHHKYNQKTLLSF